MLALPVRGQIFVISCQMQGPGTVSRLWIWNAVSENSLSPFYTIWRFVLLEREPSHSGRGLQVQRMVAFHEKKRENRRPAQVCPVTKPRRSAIFNLLRVKISAYHSQRLVLLLAQPCALSIAVTCIFLYFPCPLIYYLGLKSQFSFLLAK